MNFRDAASYMTDHPLPILLGVWAVTMIGVYAKFNVWPRVQPKRPVKHGPEYMASKANADTSIARLDLAAPKEP